MMRIQVHYYDREQAIAFACPNCQFVIWSGDWKLTHDGKPEPAPWDVVFRHFKNCPNVMSGGNHQFRPVLHIAAKA